MWKVAIDAAEKKVNEKVVELLLQLHTNVDFGMEHLVPHFEDQFIESCFRIINEQLDGISNRTPE